MSDDKKVVDLSEVEAETKKEEMTWLDFMNAFYGGAQDILDFLKSRCTKLEDVGVFRGMNDIRYIVGEFADPRMQKSERIGVMFVMGEPMVQMVRDMLMGRQPPEALRGLQEETDKSKVN